MPRMTIVAVINQKGGVGKTTLALNLAYALARRGSTTVLVDLDPQGAIGLSLASKSGPRKGISDWIHGGDASSYIVNTRLPELSLLPAGAFDPATADDTARALADGRAAELLEELDAMYEIVIVDTPAGLIGITPAVLRHAHRAIIPVQAEPLALRTLPQTLSAVLYQQERSETLAAPHVILTMTDLHDPTALAVAEELWELLPDELVMQTSIPRDPVFARSSAVGVPVGLLHRRPPPVAGAFDNLANELEPHLDLAEGQHDDPIYLLD